jgi:diaminopropionate ammonia-lyase
MVIPTGYPCEHVLVDRQRILAFHRSLPGYRPTPLVEVRRTAARIGVPQLRVKNEAWRFDLGAYKILGAAWAVARALEGRAEAPLELVAASEGNHGRAVARAARWRGLGARIFVPAGAAAWRVDRIRGEGAEVVATAATYDDAVRAAAEYADDRDRLLITDTGLTGAEESPRHVVDGYSTLFGEIDGQLEEPPEWIAVQMGVGSLAAAAVAHYAADRPETRVLGVEPAGADCIGRSIAAGKILEAAGPYDARMAGLNCGWPSMTAWPVLRDGLGACAAVSADEAQRAAEWLAEDGIFTTPTGAAGVAGLAKRAAAMGARTVLAIATEGEAR